MFKINFNFCAKSGGGLFLGIQYHFASGTYDDIKEECFCSRRIRIGLIFWTIDLELNTNRQRLNED